MSWQQWVLIAIHALGGIVTVSTVGHERPPTTPGMAALMVALQGGLVWMIVSI